VTAEGSRTGSITVLEALEPLGDWATKHIDLIFAAEAG
jgi:hypothetical protein